MNKGNNSRWIMASVIVCCILMALVDGVLRPSYGVKSFIKILLFFGTPLFYSHFHPEWSWRKLFSFEKGTFGKVLLLGLSIYLGILAAYFILQSFMEPAQIVALLGENAGVTGENFFFVALYISFINSLLEEFFFRGFAFLALREHLGRKEAHLFSAISFSAYHTAIMLGWFSPILFLLALIGLAIGGIIFNALDEKNGIIFPSWAVHMFSNFAINTVGFILFGII